MFEIFKSSSVRIKTGLVMGAVVLGIAILNSFTVFWLFFGILAFVGTYEASKLYDYYDNKIYIHLLFIWIAAFWYPKPEDLAFVSLVYIASILAYHKRIEQKVVILLLYPVIPFLFLWSLYISYGLTALIWLLFVVAGADIGAYFTGRAIGKTKFCETSPNKTLEGVIGGIATATVLGALFAIGEYEFFHVIVISAIVALASVFGDLFESYLKREAGVKDSGDIFPGHGGVLDRLDGYLFGSIIMLVLLRAIY